MKAVLTAFALLAPSAAHAAGAAAPRNYFLELYVLQILGALAVFSLLSESAERRGFRPARLRLWWNWGLLLSFAVCALSGLALFLPLAKPLAKILFRVHVWSGAACCWAGLYHTAKRAGALVRE
ncbi:MAG: hypothetical protein A2049_11815 [Elusimicrobia bacterium GWA2_62_23]|nr:MAG: hypothetical protein A2049_11815 [Elusimicrobia bacterium GWA2_62_23]OGR69207.1 MAG: hypothetical protein A2179_06670 [Elusimicrobia bacterium GWC2_63_65]